MTMLKTFDLKGNKQSFANWISNLSPCETPFISMIPKESVDQVQYSWQTDALSKAVVATGEQEGTAAVASVCKPTAVVTNFTKIFRKAVRVSDTTKKIALYGRTSELAYQMEKAGLEIKRDLEHYILHSEVAGKIGATGSQASEASGIFKLIADKAAKDPDTGAEVHVEHEYTANASSHFGKKEVFDMTYNLYLVGSRANKIMVHPMHMHVFSDMIGTQSNALAAKTPHLHRMFEGLDTKYNAFVTRLRDPLGQEFEVIPNRYMPKNKVFFFNEADWTQMVLRSPEKTELGRTGATDKFMIEMEVGLRHRNPFASGLLVLKQSTVLVAAEEPVEKKARKAAK